MTTDQLLNKSHTFSVHLPHCVANLREYLNGLTVEELVSASLQHGQNRHDHLNLGSNRTSVAVSDKTAYLVRRFAKRHGISLIGAFDILLWSGLYFRHGKDLPKLPTLAKAPVMPEQIKPDGKTKGRPRSGQG